MEMRLESFADRFLDDVERRFWDSVEDARADAEAFAPKRSRRLASRIEVQRVGRLEARIAAPGPYGKAQEKGAYIEPKAPRKVLHFRVGGQWRSAKAVRIPSHPYLRPAGRAWGRRLADRLRTSGARAR